MITIKVQTVKKAAELYLDEHLSVGLTNTEGEDKGGSQGLSNAGADATESAANYYSKDSEPIETPMKWFGKTAKYLGIDINKNVTKEEFKSLLENKNPVTKKQLTQRTVEGRRLYFDATVSAPKSVSIMAITMGDQRLIKAHEKAVQLAMNELEKLSQTRVRVNLQNTVRKTNNFIGASVVHMTSRANDPQLHSHNLIFNATWDDVEKKFKALEAYEIYNSVDLYTEVYRNELAKEVISLGYEIETAKYGWELKCVPYELRELFSKRSSTIKEAASLLKKKLGRDLTNNELSLVTHQTRKSKSKCLTLTEAIRLQKEQLSEKEIKNLEDSIKLAKFKANNMTQKFNIENGNEVVTQAEKKALDFAINHCFERKSVVEKKEILESVIKSTYGLSNIKTISNLIDQRKDLLRSKDGEFYSTIKGLAQEYFVSHFAQSRIGKYKDEDQQDLEDKALESLRNDQLQALMQINNNKDQVMIFEGGAGTGKSHVLKILVDEKKKHGINVLAAAPTTGATQNLVKDLGVKEAITIQKILVNINTYSEQLRNGYLIIDEAGFLSLNQLEQIFNIADEHNTKILLVGDTKQHHGVEAGDALRILKTYTDIEITNLNVISRQKRQDYKEAVQLIQDRQFKKGWEKFERMNVIHSQSDFLKEKGDNLKIDDLEIKFDYNKIFSILEEKQKDHKSVIVVTPTRLELDTITKSIRNNIFGKMADEGPTKEVLASVHFTLAEKANTRKYIANGEHQSQIYFHKKTNGFDKDTQWSVMEVKNETLILRNKAGNVSKFKPDIKNANGFDVCEKKTIPLKKGDLIAIQKNSKEDRLTNGDIVKIKSINGDEITFEDGRKIDKNFKHMDYGYVTTSYSAQGKTCDHVIVCMSNRSGKAMNAEQFYVSTSRGKQGIDIFVEDKEFVKAAIEKLGSRDTAFSLVGTDKTSILSELNSQDESIAQLRKKALELAESHSLFAKSKSKSNKENSRTKKWKEKQRKHQKEFYNKHKDLMEREIAKDKSVDVSRNKKEKDIDLEMGI